MTTLRVLLHVATQRDYELHSLDLSTAFLQGSLHEEIWLRRPPGFTGTFPVGTQWSLRRPVYGLRQASREWHDTLRTTLAALGFSPSTADPSLFLRTDTSLPPFYVLVYVNDLVFATADTEAQTLVNRAVLAEPRPPYLSSSTTTATATATTTAAAAATATATAPSATATSAMASPPVLSFDAEGRPIKFETWLDDLHLFLQLTAREDISLYDHALGTIPPATTAAATACSQ
ncbi:unnamed protein product [Closterium sp. NIES-53]